MRHGARPKNTKKTLRRILSYINEYRIHLIFVLFFVLISSGASIVGTFFLKPLINNYILPFVGQQNPDFSGFLLTIGIMALIYAVGALSTYVYNRIMLTISTSTLYKIRTEMYEHMQSLPIKYFDTHTHGELMSRYTNDTDALRNMLSQSFVNLISSAATVIGVFIAMCILSPILTIVVVLMLFVMIFIIGKLGAKSGK